MIGPPPKMDCLSYIYKNISMCTCLIFSKKCIKKSLKRKISQTTQNDIKQKYFCAEITCNTRHWCIHQTVNHPDGTLMEGATRQQLFQVFL